MARDQLLALLMHDVDDRAEPQQVLIPGVAADLGTALARGSIAELITDRIPEVPGDVQLVGCLPGPGRGDLDGAVVLVADPRPLDGDLAEGRLEGERPRPPALDTGPALPRRFCRTSSWSAFSMRARKSRPWI